jgi:hypothetical protein
MRRRHDCGRRREGPVLHQSERLSPRFPSSAPFPPLDAYFPSMGVARGGTAQFASLSRSKLSTPSRLVGRRKICGCRSVKAAS